MKTYSHLWQYLAEFFLEWEMFQTKVVEKIKTEILYLVTFSENRSVYEIMSKNMVELERTHTIWRLRVAYWISKQAHVRALAPTPTHSHTDAHACRHPRARTRTHTQRTMSYLLLSTVTLLNVTLHVHYLSCYLCDCFVLVALHCK
jgi:hypothetical protein